MASSKPTAGERSALDLSTAELKKAAALLKDGKPAEAAAVLDALQKQVSGDPRIYLLAMHIADATGRPDAALEAVRLAVKTAPDWPAARLELALCLARHNRFREAATEAESLARAMPGEPRILDAVVQIAHRAGYPALAAKYLPQLIALSSSGNEERQRQLANHLAALGRHDEALVILKDLVESAPEDARLLENRAQIALLAGDRAQAARDWEFLSQREPENTSHAYHLAVSRGETPRSQPAALSRDRFNGMAEVYDHRIVREMGYQLPKIVAEWILATYPDRKLNVLDLGCGTGLLGACLGRLDGFLIGVDIAEKMLEQAQRHNVYDRFHQVDLLDALSETPAELYEVLAALDVFIYTGDLATTLPDAFRILKPGGTLVFSCEAASEDEGDLALRPTQRYAHRQAHVEGLCREAGFSDIEARPCDLRLELGKPVAGYWVTARKA